MPHWLANIPWWIRIPGILGGALMSAFAGKFPEGLQLLGLYTGIVLAVVSALATIWHSVDVWRTNRGKPRLKLEPLYVVILGLLVALGGASWQLYRSATASETATPSPVKNLETKLRLRFGDAGTLPTAIDSANIWRWYALANVFVQLFPDGTKKETKVWSVFVTFERPIDVKQVLVQSDGQLPPHEVKDRDSRSVVVTFGGDIINENIDLLLYTTGNVTPTAAPVTSTTVHTAIPKRARPFYDETDLRLMLGALREVREVVDKKIAPASWALNDASQSWTRMLTKDGSVAVAQKLEEIIAPVRDAYNQLNQWLYNNQHYDSELRPIISGYDAIGTEEGALRTLIDELKEYANAQNVNLAKILQPRYEQWAAVHPKVGEWIGKTDARIRDKTKELREWKNEE